MTPTRKVYSHHPSGSISRTADPQAVLAYHRTMPGYSPTPLVDVPEIAERLGVAKAWVKDESNRLGMPAFKILGASWAIYQALRTRLGIDQEPGTDLADLRARLAGGPALTLVAATDGNHGRAVARVASMLGLKAHILVPQDMVRARIAALEQEGARVTVVPGTYDEAVARSAQLEDDTHIVISDTSWDGYRQVPDWVIDGYSTIAQEIRNQLHSLGEALPTVLAVQVGVGSFAASIARGFGGPDVTIVSVEPTKAACAQASAEAGELQHLDGQLDSSMAGLNCGTPSAVAWPDLVAGVKYFVSVDDSDTEEAMRTLAAAGVVSGESGAAGLAGLLAFSNDLSLTPADRVLVVSTEGATDPENYNRVISQESASVSAAS